MDNNEHNTGDFNTGDYNTGDFNAGNCNAGNYNAGNCNAGHRNTGDYNTGDCNAGNYNAGNCNAGDYNAGNCNAGGFNTGHRNTGYSNIGRYNLGDYNTGDYNIGNFNTGNFNSGFFNNESCLGYLFNKPAIITTEIRERLSCLNVKPRLSWVASSDMTDEEKEKNPDHKKTGGFLRGLGKSDYSTLTEADRNFIKSLPNYDDDVFFQITGIRLNAPKICKENLEDIKKLSEFLESLNNVIKKISEGL